MAESTTGMPAKSRSGNGALEGAAGAAGAAASDLFDQVKGRASSQVAQQQGRVADGLGSVAGALRKAGDDLRSNNETLASYADMAVDEIERLSTRLRDKQPGEYLSDLEGLARRRPAAFLGGAFLVGLGLARFLKSTQPRRSASSGRSGDYGSDHAWPRSPGGMGYPSPTRIPGSAAGSSASTPGAPIVAGPQGAQGSAAGVGRNAPGVSGQPGSGERL